MDIKNFRKKYKLSNSDIIRIINYKYPRFCKYALFMCTNSKEFGVQLTPGAEEVLYTAVTKKKENRKKSKQLTVRVYDEVYNFLKTVCDLKEITVQDMVEQLIVDYLNEGMW